MDEATEYGSPSCLMRPIGEWTQKGCSAIAGPVGLPSSPGLRGAEDFF